MAPTLPQSGDLSNSKVMFIGAVEDHWQLYSDNPADYTKGSPIGFGASSIVYSARYHPPSNPNAPIPCALKVLDLDSLPPRSLSLLQRETTLMSLSKHPNVLRVRGSWMEGHKLHIALRLMNKGSAADVMHYGWAGGMEEEVVKCILKQALKGLNYLHINGFIHRDIKAANLLIDDDGTVLLGDLGVAADLTEESSQSPPAKNRRTTAESALSEPVVGLYQSTTSSSDASAKFADRASRPHMQKRKSFVGTPCWMAPELIQGRQYDSSADIWSFGITALELAQGRAPRSRESPHKVLLKTIQEAAPVLDRDGASHKFSKAFHDVVAGCLIKDPSLRPTAEQLLQSPFFKATKKKSYLVDTILKDLPPLTMRQQRRALPSAQTRASIESWDFATTIHSPTTSVFRRLRLSDIDGFPHQTGSDGYDESHRSPSSTHTISGSESGLHSRSISFVDVETLHDEKLVARHTVPVIEENSSDTDHSSVASSPSDLAFRTRGGPRSESPPTSDSNMDISRSTSHVNDDSVAAKDPVAAPEAASISAIPSSSESGSTQRLASTPSPSKLSMSGHLRRVSSGTGLWKKVKGVAKRGSILGGPVKANQ